jgi:c(7)-type cytochrome triheme protein
MKKLIVLLVVLLSVALVAGAMAQPKGKTVVFETKMGNVDFSGDTHADAGLKCNDCHPAMFPMKAGSSFAAPHKETESCGACHNGTKAFSSKKDCKMCHKK